MSERGPEERGAPAEHPDTTSVERDRGLPPDVPEDEAVLQRNAASGGWQGVTEVIENDFEQARLAGAAEDDENSDARGGEGPGAI
jgi:hypothetical protein